MGNQLNQAIGNQPNHPPLLDVKKIQTTSKKEIHNQKEEANCLLQIWKIWP